MAQGVIVSALLLVALAVPGWALIGLSGAARDWRPVQRWCLALALGIAFYPVLLYALRALAPGFGLERHRLIGLLLLCAAAAVWSLRRDWRSVFGLAPADWLVIAVLGATLFTRYWIIRDEPYPAWSDSLQHVLLTQLTAEQGRLPFDLLPYAPTPLSMYHLGLYALSAVAQWLSGSPPHTALLWTAQTLNGLCGLGVFLVLDRKLGRTAALAGAVTVGLLSHQPAYYVNWGRFTQVASQAVLLVALLVSWDAIRAWTRGDGHGLRARAGYLALSALLNAGVFLLHFRASAFYLALLALVLAWELRAALRARRLRQFTAAMLLLGSLSLLLVLPAVVEAVGSYLSRATAEAAGASADQAAGEAIYHALNWQAVPLLVARVWLIVLAVAAGALALVRRNRVAVLSLAWMALLIAIGSAYRLGVPALDLVNLSGVLIAFYLPVGLLVGAGAHELVNLAPEARRQSPRTTLLYAVFVAGFVLSHARVADLEPDRYFVTDDDLAAMAWINENTPRDASFAINTYFWMPDVPHGTDAGYWIPYFTGRQTTASTMLFPLSDAAYRSRIVAMSRAADQLDLDALRELGVDYIYSGARGDFTGVGLSKHVLTGVQGIRAVFESGGASVWQIEAGGP